MYLRRVRGGRRRKTLEKEETCIKILVGKSEKQRLWRKWI
jgi:hypothetical protein